jgi:FMN phosphatase YigB (HAD superfamily)
MISDATGIEFELLTKFYIESVVQMKVDLELVQATLDIKQKGTPIALVTNNMDIFNKVTIPNKNLKQIFPLIINSYDYGFLKQDPGSKLFATAIKTLGFDSFTNILFVDDSKKNCDIFESLGGQAYNYDNLENFITYLKS